MKILFITRLFSPHIGGVERHVFETAKKLKVKGESVTILTEKYDKTLKNEATVDGIKVIRFSYPHIKILGVFCIWIWFWKNRNLILENDIIHVHDVFIWYFPFCLIYPKKNVFTTIHGLEWEHPLSPTSLWQKRLAVKLSSGSIGVGKFLEKYIKTRFDLFTYGAAALIHLNTAKKRNSIVYVGRLEENTGLLKFLRQLKRNPKYEVDFCGDGPLRKECEKFGMVHGFLDPKPFLKNAEYCVPGGYLAALEGLSFRCKLKLFWNNKVKEDYWTMSPFVKKDIGIWAKSQTWDKLASEYLNLWKK